MANTCGDSIARRQCRMVVRIPVDAGHQFRSMPGQHSGPCRATVRIPRDGEQRFHGIVNADSTAT
jgi:hypothetical protein